MKCRLNIRVTGCNKALLEDIQKQLNETDAIKELNEDIKLEDGTVAKSQGEIHIEGRDIVVTGTFEGKGEAFEKRMHECDTNVRTSELRNDFHREFNHDDFRCNRVITTFSYLSYLD
jgi:hypothetical protein